MKLLDRFFKGKRERDHQVWLDAHPGKGSSTSVEPTLDAGEQQRMRDQMESELDTQRKQREQA